MNYINRFGDELVKDKSIHYDYKIGDVIKKGCIIQVITGLGIYDNQYWTEKIYEDGCYLSEGNYIFITGLEVIKGKDRDDAIKMYITALEDNYTKYPWLKEISLKHIECFKSK